MYHRYGRHGPHAWLRQRQRIAEQHLPVVASVVVIICIQVPTNAERVITIMPNPDDFDPEDEGNTSSLSSPESRLIDPPQAERAMYADLKSQAEFKAEKHYHQDLQNMRQKGVEWPLEEDLVIDANVKANDALGKYFTPNLDREATRDFFVKNYMRKYSEWYREKIPNEEARRVECKARCDAKNDKQDNVDLPEAELNCQAIIRIQEILVDPTRAISGYITRIMEYVPRYKRAYREEKDRSSRSGPFSCGCQSPSSSCGCQPSSGCQSPSSSCGCQPSSGCQPPPTHCG